MALTKGRLAWVHADGRHSSERFAAVLRGGPVPSCCVSDDT